MKFNLFITILISASLLIISCSVDKSESEVHEEQTYYENRGQLYLSIQDQAGNPVSPSVVHVYSAVTAVEGEPLAVFHGNEDGIVEGWFEKNSPVIIYVEAAWHQPLNMFLPSTTLDLLSVDVIPSEVYKKENIKPAIVGDFNYFDLFSRVEMKLNDDGYWAGEIETDQPTIHYQISGFAQNRNIHGTAGELHFQSELQSLVSVLEHESNISDKVSIMFDPNRFPSAEQRAILQFDRDVPEMIRGVAKLYTAMKEQAVLVELFQNDALAKAELIEEYLDHIRQIKDSYNHRDVDLAHRIAQAYFIEHIQHDSHWIDQLLHDIDATSEIWLLHPRIVHDLFTHSSKMEPISKNLWDIYRQHRFENIQSEALFSLLNFHYDRGEDEEWYEAHFELVRSYPESKRINYSYRNGFAPESVVHIDRYFPNLAYGPLDQQADSLRPADINSSMSILYFWSFNDVDVENQFEILKSLQQRYSELDLEIMTIALNQDRNRTKRFHQQRQHTWETGLDSIISPQVQVLGITSTPHTIFLDGSNRVLYHGESILEDGRLPEFVEEFYRDL